ncbi:MAG TPA: D-glucuronyl C5-epimerase family protein [Solirubrobacteraceae bacterium]
MRRKLTRIVASGLVLAVVTGGQAARAQSPVARADARRQLLILTPSGRTYLRAAPFLAGAAREPMPTASAAPVSKRGRGGLRARSSAHRLSAAGSLQRLERSGAISSVAYQSYRSSYLAAQHTLRKLSGTRRGELGAVLANIDAMAGAGQFTPSRLPALMLTLERNRQWWSTGPLLGSDQRVSFPGSRIVWEYYPGQGIEIQWLATFGEANGYFLSHQDSALKELLDEVLGLATQRAGGIAWEYLFSFDGGSPPWTSGLSQGTALQAFARGWQRLQEPAYLQAAKAAVGIFQTAPPAGVRVPTSAGAHYLEYTYAPSERIINGFVQAVIGLYDYTKITGDPLGLELFEAGDAEARAELVHYNTGSWSMYDQHSESDLNYHELLTEFLEHLCQRTRQGPPIAAPAGTPPSGPASGTPVGQSGGSSPASASTAHAAAAAAAASENQIPGDEVYCTTAEEFKADLHTPPAITLLSHTLRTSSRAGVQFSLSKISSVSITIRRANHTVWSNSASVEGGKPRILWVTPSKPGAYTLTARAVDLTGNATTTSATIRLKRH